MKLFTAPFILFLSFSALAQYPDNIYPDTAYSPFGYGVASGDPLQDKVIIWTKVQVPSAYKADVSLLWEVAADSSFKNIINKGNVSAGAEHDYTAKVDVDGLKAGASYFYRFTDPSGRVSQIGKARTLPPDSVNQFKLAVVSCSSVWSGYFNAYRRIAERNDIDYVVHLGDYAYDYADRQELIRMPAEYPKDAANLKEWRERHTYYLLDPDLRAARQNKTWIAEWDNHDLNVNDTGKVQEPIQAFYEYLPVRMPNPEHPERIYRSFHFGKLADLIMIDMLYYRGIEKSAQGYACVLGNEQDAWFKKQLYGSSAQWKLVGNQEMMNDWLSEGGPKFITKNRGNGRVWDPGNWNGFPDDRNCLFDFVDTGRIKNTVVLTGDAHMSFIMDMTTSPKNKKRYNKRTGEGSVGVEVLGPSITRGNMDEAGVPKAFIPLAQTVSKSLNPHHLWVQFSKHGYTTLDVTPQRCIAEFWYSKILKKTDKETFGKGFIVKNEANHWERKFINCQKRSTHPKKAQ